MRVKQAILAAVLGTWLVGMSAAPTRADDVGPVGAARDLGSSLLRHVAPSTPPSADVEESQVAAAEQPADDGALQERLAQRNAPWQAAQQLVAEADFEKAEEQFRVVLDIERDILGDDSPELISTLGAIAHCQEQLENWDSARATRAETVERSIAAFGEDDYRTVDARLANDHLELIEKLTPQERRRLRTALRHNDEAVAMLRAGQHDKAVALFEEVLKTRRTLLGEQTAEYALSVNNLAAGYDAQDDLERAEPLFREVIDIRKAVYGERHPQYATSLHNLAYMFYRTGKTEQAEPLFLEKLRVIQEFPEQGQNRIQTLDLIAQCQQQRGAWDEAIATREQAVAETEALTGPDHFRVIDARLAVRNLEQLRDMSAEQRDELQLAQSQTGRLYELMNQGNAADALALAESMQKTYRRLLGERHPDYAGVVNSLARLHENQGDAARAERLYQQALRIRQEVLGEHHPDYAISLNNLAHLNHALGRFEQAEPLYIQALEVIRANFGEQNASYASALSNLAELYRVEAKYEQAEQLHRYTLEIRRTVLGEQHPDYAVTLNNLALVYQMRGHFAEAEPLFRQAISIIKETSGPQSFNYAVALGNLGFIHQLQGNLDQAVPLFEESLEIKRSLLGEQHPEYALSLNNLAVLYESQSDFDRAEPMYRQALEIWDAHQMRTPDYATCLSNLARLLQTQSRHADAEPLLQQALEVRQGTLGELHPDYAASVANLGVLYTTQADYARAEPLLQQALEIRKQIFGDQHPQYAASLRALADLYKAQGDDTQADPLLKQAEEIEKAAGVEPTE